MVFSGWYSASEFTISSLQFCKLQAKGSQKGNTQVKLIQFLFSCESIQKYLSFLFSCAVFGQHTEDDSHYILSHSDSVTPLQHWQFSSPCSLWVFSGEKQILLFGNTCFHFISFSFCHILVMSSFKNCLENGNRLVIASKKKTKTKSKKTQNCICEGAFPQLPSALGPDFISMGGNEETPTDFASEPKRFLWRVYWEYFWWCLWCRKKEVQELVPLQTLATVSSPSWANTQLPQGLYLPKSHTH